MTTQETVTFDAISYALAKQVPSMERGFAISTSYGDIVFDPDEAPQVVAVVRHLLEAKHTEYRLAQLRAASPATEERKS